MKEHIISTVSEIDNFLLKGLLAGNSEAFERLYEDYFPVISKMIVKNSGSIEEAQDIFQEAVVILYDKISQNDLKLTSQLRTYLYAICHRLWLKELNSRNKKMQDLHSSEIEIVSIEEDIEMHHIINHRFEVMESSLSSLGNPCENILRDFYLNNLSMQEISEKFGYSNADNAKNQKYKCLQRLKKLFFSKLK